MFFIDTEIVVSFPDAYECVFREQGEELSL